MKMQQSFTQHQSQVQKLAMTQQLQQAIQILQFNSEELMTYIDNIAMENPLIEVGEADYRTDFVHRDGSDFSDYMNQIPDQHVSLFETLIDQVHLNYRKTFLRSIILYMVERIDSNGYLTFDLQKVAAEMNATDIQVLDALTLLQQLDPAGVGARNLQECLMLQTERDHSAPEMAYIVLEEQFDALVNRHWEVIAKAFDIPLKEVQLIFDYIKTLSPNPGADYASTQGLYIIPDLKVTVRDGVVETRSNKRSHVAVNFQSNYFKRMDKLADTETKKYLSEKKQEYNWLEKTLAQRGDTIFNVGSLIVKKQEAFFTESGRPLKPLTLKEIADELGIHESTVSRTVNGKYLETSFGVFELRSFFVNSTGKDEALSVDAAKQALKKIVNDEDKTKPLSDQKLMDLLKEQNIEISRRTVAKYREAMSIPSSSKRKRFE